MKRKSKSKSSSLKQTVLDKSHLYVKPTIDNEIDSESEEDPEPKRKATEADKERKREKRKIKKQLKKEVREKSKKKDITEAMKQGINYLHKWHHARDAWSFKKKQQIWLLNNAFEFDCVSDENFEILLNYIVELKGEAKTRLIAKCEEVIQKHEEKFSDGSITTEEKQMFERARNILQILV